MTTKTPEILSSCCQAKIYWYDQNGMGVSKKWAKYGRCGECEKRIPVRNK